MLQKTQYTRSRALLDLAQKYPCMITGRHDGTTVAAHYQGELSNLFGKGYGIKPSDSAIAFLCSEWHDIIDGRKKSSYSAEELCILWCVAHCRTLDQLFADGHLQVLRRPDAS